MSEEEQQELTQEIDAKERSSDEEAEKVASEFVTDTQWHSDDDEKRDRLGG